MSAESAESFLDNWAYLKTELNWLERLLMMAVARQRKDSKDIDRLARSSADKATSHWWKGVISLEGSVAYDEFRKAAQLPATKPYQQQLDARIKLSQERGVVLALPLLRDRLGLSIFEKNLVLMGIAPEVNRRYGRLYHYLQGDERSIKTDLPTVDLVLRLMCRNDEEWRRARSRLVQDSPLLRYDLMQYVAEVDTTFLNQSIKLSEELVDYLLAEQPTPEDLKTVLRYRLQPMQPSLLSSQVVNVSWETLILPEKARRTLQRLADLARLAPTAAAGSAVSLMVLLAGASGTGKTMAAQAIATALNTPLISVDLATLEPEIYPQLLHELSTTAPTVLYIRSSECWLRRSSLISAAGLQSWLEARQRQPGVTLFSVTHAESVSLTWLKQMLPAVVLPKPQASDRLLLWQRAIPPEVTSDPTVDWQSLAQQLALTGGEINTIAQTALSLMTAANTPELSLETLVQAIEQHGCRLKSLPRRVEKAKRRLPRAKKSTQTAQPKTDTQKARGRRQTADG